jgi:hypothetical protein
MSYKKCPRNKILVKSYKSSSGKKIKSFCRSKPSYKSSRTKKVKSIKSVKKDRKRSYMSPPKRVLSKPVNEVKKRSKVDRTDVEGNIRKLRIKLDQMTGRKELSDKEIKTIFNKYSKNLNKCIPEDYEIKKFIGKGVNGSVYLICKNASSEENCRIIKIQKIKDKKLIENEIRMQKLFYSKGLAPKIHNVCNFKMNKNNYILIDMEPIFGTLDTLLTKKLDTKFLRELLTWVTNYIKKLCELNLTHGDFHWGNFGYNVKPTGKLSNILIDFSWSSAKKCNPRLEFIQLLRTSTFDNIEKNNSKYLEDSLYEIYTKEYNNKLLKNNDAYDREWNKLMNVYEKNI